MCNIGYLSWFPTNLYKRCFLVVNVLFPVLYMGYDEYKNKTCRFWHMDRLYFEQYISATKISLSSSQWNPDGNYVIYWRIFNCWMNDVAEDRYSDTNVAWYFKHAQMWSELLSPGYAILHVAWPDKRGRGSAVLFKEDSAVEILWTQKWDFVWFIVHRLQQRTASVSLCSLISSHHSTVPREIVTTGDYNFKLEEIAQETT